MKVRYAVPVIIEHVNFVQSGNLSGMPANLRAIAK